MTYLGFSILFFLKVVPVSSFSTNSFVLNVNRDELAKPCLFSTASDSIENGCTFGPLFNFSNVEENAVSNFERIDE
jgi:hypothetical protein